MMKTSTRIYIMALHLLLSLTEQLASSYISSTIYILLFSCTYILKRFSKSIYKILEPFSLLIFICFSHSSFHAQCFIAFAAALCFPKCKHLLSGCLYIALLFRSIYYADLYALPQVVAIVAHTYLQLENPNKAKDTKQDEDWKLLCNALPYGLAIQNYNTNKWLYCNHALCELLDAQSADLAFIKMEGLRNKFYSESVRNCQRLAEKIGGGSFSDPDNSYRGAEGLQASMSVEDAETSKLFDISCKTIKWNKELAYLYTLKDVTERNKIEHLRLANLIKSRILRSLSHELRTPINCILNSLEYCKQKLEDDEESWVNINVALTNTNILLNKYNDILDFLKIEMRQLELECVDFDIRELIKEVSNLLAMQIGFRGLQYSCDIDDKVPKKIYSDPNRILQIVLNLMENAIKYNNPNGSIKLTIKSLPQIADDAIEITVSDTGHGIDLEKLSTLFSLEEIGNERNGCQRVSVSLPIAYYICQKLGGELKVNTQLGHGSTFTFQIVPSHYATSSRSRMDHESESQKEEENNEWDIAEDSYEMTIVHQPRTSSRVKTMDRRISEIREPPKSVDRAGFIRREPLMQPVTLSYSSGLNVRGDCSATNRLSMLTDMTPDAKPFTHFGISQKTDKMMMEEIIKSTRTPKRSFSNGDLLEYKNDKKHKDVKQLKQRIARLKEFRALIRETVRKDVYTIRSNVIRSKNELFVPSAINSSTRRRRHYKQNASYEFKLVAAPSRIRSVRNELLNFHIDHELSRNAYKISEESGSLGIIE